MAKTTFTAKELSLFFSNGYKHKFYDETVKLAAATAIHADGAYPKEMIEERRPSETKEVKAYREKLFKPVTKPVWSKVIIELNKIRRSADWAIKYPAINIPRINEGERLEDYCELKYPHFTSVTNWVFKTMLPVYTKDANAVVAVLPGKEVSATEYRKPEAIIFESANVIDFVSEDYCVLKSTDRVVFTDVNGYKSYGNIYFILTTTSFIRYEQTQSNQYIEAYRYEHNIGKLPAVKVGGVVRAMQDNVYLFESRLASMLPRLDEALREYNDLQAEVVQNVYNEKWEIVPDECRKCKGTGKVGGVGFSQSNDSCGECEGTGLKQRSPFSKLQIRMPMAGESSAPIPPAGYIQKDTSIVRIQDERVDKHEFKALSAINMEYLSQTPLNQSGVAKEVDRDALNTFVHAIAEDLIEVMDRIYFFINEYRYTVVVPDGDVRKSMLPFIPVPDKFDMLSTAYLEKQLQDAKASGVNPIIVNAMEIDYVSKKFVGDNATLDKVMLSIQLDPLSGVTEDDKMGRLASGGISKLTYIISSNIRMFIDRAFEEYGEGFAKLKADKQKEIMKGYATELQAEMSEGSKMVIDVMGGETDTEDEPTQ